VFILDSLSKYRPTDQLEAEGIIERVTPRLQHANSAVVMSAVKVRPPLPPSPGGAIA
jgi:AP-1 complex subunit beta-1